MKRKLFRKNLYSFSKQGLAENLLPVSKEFKKKLVKSSRLSASFSGADPKRKLSLGLQLGIDEGTTSKLERNFSADTPQSVRSKVPYYPLNRSKRVQRGKARLFSQFFNKHFRTQTEHAKEQKMNPKLTFGSPKLDAWGKGIKIDLVSDWISKTDPKNPSNWQANLAESAKLIPKTSGADFNSYELPLEAQKQNISRINLLLSVEQVKTEIQVPSFTKTKQKKEYSPFLNQIRESKKLRYLYGNLTATQLKKIVLKARQLPGAIADNLLILLESRLDVVCQRCQFFATIKSARQYIIHKGIWINSMLVTTPSFQLSPGDVIRLIEPNNFDIENSFLCLPLKNWKNMCKSIENIEIDELSNFNASVGFCGGSQSEDTLELDKKIMLQNTGEKASQEERQKQSKSNSQNFKITFPDSEAIRSKFQKAKANFLELAENQYHSNFSALDVSSLQILASRFLFKNKLYWKAHTSSNFDKSKFSIALAREDFLSFHSFEKNKNTLDFANLYKNWFLLSFFTSAFTTNSDLLRNTYEVGSQKQIESIANLLESLNSTHFISLIVANLPSQFQAPSSKNTSYQKIADKSTKFDTLKGTQSKAWEFHTKLERAALSNLENKGFNKINLSHTKNSEIVIGFAEEINGNFFSLNKKMLLENNFIKKFFFDFAFLIHLEIESLFFSSQLQQVTQANAWNKFILIDKKNFQHSIKKGTQKNSKLSFSLSERILNDANSGIWYLLQCFFVAYRNFFKKESSITNQKYFQQKTTALRFMQKNIINSNFSNSIEKKKLLPTSYTGGGRQALQTTNTLLAKKIFTWAQKLSSFFLQKLEKKATQSSQNLSNKVVSLSASPQFSIYLLCIFLLHLQKRFLIRYWKRKRLMKNNFLSSTTNFSTCIGKIQKDSSFYQKKSKALHLEVSFQSLSAIFLFPPQRVYLNAIIDLQTVVKSIAKI